MDGAPASITQTELQGARCAELQSRPALARATRITQAAQCSISSIVLAAFVRALARHGDAQPVLVGRSSGTADTSAASALSRASSEWQ